MNTNVNLEKEFVLYPEALELKELGFDEVCFGYYNTMGFNRYFDNIKNSDNLIESENIKGNWCTAPTYSQVFRWFREKYGYDCSFEDELVYDDDDKEIEMWDFFIYKTKQGSDKKMTFCSNNYDTYVESFCREEAELACLRKLIEIVKNE